jgi:hypothetical protein
MWQLVLVGHTLNCSWNQGQCHDDEKQVETMGEEAIEQQWRQSNRQEDDCDWKNDSPFPSVQQTAASFVNNTGGARPIVPPRVKFSGKAVDGQGRIISGSAGINLLFTTLSKVARACGWKRRVSAHWLAKVLVEEHERERNIPNRIELPDRSAQLGLFHALQDRTHDPAHYAALHGLF